MGRPASVEPTQHPGRANAPARSGAFGAALLTAAVGLGTALVFVRVMLDWSDRQPYEGATTEARYLVLMAVALTICAVTAVAAGCVARRLRRAGARPRE